MEKRKSPLKLEEAPSQTLNKRVNPLSLEQKTVEKQPVAPIEQPKFTPYSIENAKTVKRKFVFTRLSKSLIHALKACYKDQKTGVVLENAMLEHLYHLDSKKYNEIVTILEGKEDKA